MEGLFDHLPPEIKTYVKGISKSIALPDTPESFERIASVWEAKSTEFLNQISANNLIEVNSHDPNDPRGAISLTYSDSLIFIGSFDEDFRLSSYHSIGLGKTMADPIIHNQAKLTSIVINEPIQFKTGPIKTSPRIYKIATFSDEGDPYEQEEKLRRVLDSLIESFIAINNVSLPDGKETREFESQGV